MLKMLWEAKEFNILEVNTGKKTVHESIIPVEKIKDTVWPSKKVETG